MIALMSVAAALWEQVAAQVPATNKSAIVNSKHDFRASSTASIRSQTGHDACAFCHTPHYADPSGPYLWRRNLSSREFTGYTSSTMQSPVSGIQPGEVSKLCLSCHDGTIALGDTVNDGTLPFTGA